MALQLIIPRVKCSAHLDFKVLDKKQHVRRVHLSAHSLSLLKRSSLRDALSRISKSTATFPECHAAVGGKGREA